MTPHILLADYHNEQHAAAIVQLMMHYAEDPMGGGEALHPEVQQRLVKAMSERPGIYTLLAWHAGEPVGLLNAVEGFSTFAARPLLNIHDVVVLASHRGQGIGQGLLAAAEQLARDHNCCKLTLEVLEGNQRAQQLYRQAGFAPYQLDPAMGQAIFWQKPLD